MKKHSQDFGVVVVFFNHFKQLVESEKKAANFDWPHFKEKTDKSSYKTCINKYASWK